jgi:prevent-host-death family protein
LNAADISKGRVLIVDDDPSALRAYGHRLAEAGFEVAEASGGAEALHRIETGRFDVLISDIKMPEMDGLTLLRRVRARSLDTRVILMLDTQNDEIAIQATELGALQSLVKPIKAELLEKVAAYAVRLNRARRSTLSVFRNRRSEWGEVASFTATDAKNEFGSLLERAIQGGAVVITKHDAPKAVLMSMDEYNALSRATELKLDTLSGEFDALLARMQTPKARVAMKAAFNSSPKQLGKAAVAAARKRG